MQPRRQAFAISTFLPSGLFEARHEEERATAKWFPLLQGMFQKASKEFLCSMLVINSVPIRELESKNTHTCVSNSDS